MKSIITTPDPEPFPIRNYSIHNSHSGILNSNYKSIVKQNFKNLKSNRLFTNKQKLKIWQYNRTCCSVATSLKVMLFLVMTIIAIA